MKSNASECAIYKFENFNLCDQDYLPVYKTLEARKGHCD